MPIQTTAYSLDFQNFLELVDKSLIQAAADARELAERTGTPLVVHIKKNQDTDFSVGTSSRTNFQHTEKVQQF